MIIGAIQKVYVCLGRRRKKERDRQRARESERDRQRETKREWETEFAQKRTKMSTHANIFVTKMNNKQIKLNKMIFTHHKITGSIPEKVVPVITRVCGESKS